MGRPPMKIKDFREHVRITRELLDTGEARYAANGGSRTMRFFNRHHQSEAIKLEPRIPL